MLHDEGSRNEVTDPQGQHTAPGTGGEPLRTGLQPRAGFWLVWCQQHPSPTQLSYPGFQYVGGRALHVHD